MLRCGDTGSRSTLWEQRFIAVSTHLAGSRTLLWTNSICFGNTACHRVPSGDDTRAGAGSPMVPWMSSGQRGGHANGVWQSRYQEIDSGPASDERIEN